MFSVREIIPQTVSQGQRLSVQTERVGKKKKKIFGIRMDEEDIQKIRQTARRANMEIGEFAREALAKAVAEKAEDLQRISKTKK